MKTVHSSRFCLTDSCLTVPGPFSASAHRRNGWVVPQNATFKARSYGSCMQSVAHRNSWGQLEQVQERAEHITSFSNKGRHSLNVGSIIGRAKCGERKSIWRRSIPWLHRTMRRRKKKLRSPIELSAGSQEEADTLLKSDAGENVDSRRRWQDWMGLATSLYPVYVTLGGTLAVIRPSSFAWFCAGGPTLYSCALGVIMLSMGLTIGWEDLRRLVLKHPGAIAFGFAAQYILMPTLGLVVSRAMGLPPAVTAGLVLLACCPGGTASNVVTFIGYGDVPLSVMMTICTTFGAVIVTPFLTQRLAGTLVPIDAGGLAVSTLQVVLFPVLVGMAGRYCFPRAVQKVLPFAPLVAVVTSSVLASSVFSVNVPLFQLSLGATSPLQGATASLASDAVAPLGSVVAAVFLVHAAGFALGYLVSSLAGFKEARRRAISIEVGMQNSSLGVVLATKHFASPLAPLPCALSAIMMNVMGSALAVMWRRQGPPTDDAVDT